MYSPKITKMLSPRISLSTVMALALLSELKFSVEKSLSYRKPATNATTKLPSNLR